MRPFKSSFCFGVDWETVTADDIAKVDPNARDDDGRTPFHWAARWTKRWLVDPKAKQITSANQNVQEVISALVKKGGDINARDDEDNTALHVAVVHRDNRVGDFESSECFGIDWKDPKFAEIAGLKDPHMRDKHSRTPYHWLVRWSSDEAIKEIIPALNKKGGNIDAQDDEGNTALHILIKYRGNEPNPLIDAAQ